MSYTTRFTRLIVTLPRPSAEAFGAALVELGAGAVEEREPLAPLESREVELVLTLPEDAAVDEWQSLVQSLARAFAEQLELPAAAIRIRSEDCELDYHAAWLERLVPQRLTDKLVFVPMFCRDQTPRGPGALYFEPHPSFGDGSHPTTRLAAAAVQRACERRSGSSVLDVGTGNGVLSFVAAVSGAAHAYGLDLDPEAIEAARHNARLNQLEATCVFDTVELEAIRDRFDLVVANLEPRTQVELLEGMASRVKPGGTLVLTGFLVEQAETITEPLAELGFRRSNTDAADGYALEVWQAGEGTT